ncbi:MAG: sulfite exporter TauE/SafE family protein [Polyangiaceae bacterium]
MTITPTFAFLLAFAGFFAGGLGALVGVGGGVLLVPALVLVFHVPFPVAVAASLVAVVATSTSAGSVYVGTGMTNVRLGVALELATTLGGLAGGIAASHVPQRALLVLFAAVVFVTAFLLARAKDPTVKKATALVGAERGWEERDRLAGAYVDVRRGELVHYEADRVWIGNSVAFLAGGVSGMLGVGGGFLKVPAMNLGMKVPIRVAAATSNFMIGVTAASSLFLYVGRGAVVPAVAAPVALGVVVGSILGTRVAGKFSANVLRRILAFVLFVTAVQLVMRSVGVSLGS